MKGEKTEWKKMVDLIDEIADAFNTYAETLSPESDDAFWSAWANAHRYASKEVN